MKRFAGTLHRLPMPPRCRVDRGVWKIYSTGNELDDYRQMFQTTDLSANSEVLWFKMYDGDQVGNSVNRYLNQGGGSIGVTASLIDDYLTKDGKPFIGAALVNAKKVFGDELLPTADADPAFVADDLYARTTTASG